MLFNLNMFSSTKALHKNCSKVVENGDFSFKTTIYSRKYTVLRINDISKYYLQTLPHLLENHHFDI